MKLTLNSAEFVLLLSALKIDPTAYIDASPLVALNGASMNQAMSQARRSLVERQLALCHPERGLVPESCVREVLLRVVRPAQPGELSVDIRSDGDAPIPLRVVVSHETQTATIHQRLPDGMHAISTQPFQADAFVELTVGAVDQLGCYQATDEHFALPHNIARRLCSGTAADDAPKLMLVHSEHVSRQLNAALTERLIFGRIDGAQRLCWFGDMHTLWLLTLPADGVAHAWLQRIDAATLRTAVRAMLMGAPQVVSI
jgi:hypothetical protein